MTFHDSCYLARYNDVVAEPREVLGSVAGLELRGDGAERQEQLLLRRRRRSDVDGGDARHADQRRADRARRSRPGAGTVATDCPFCMTMMRDGLAAAEANAAGTVSAVDIAEILADSLAPAPTGRQLPVIQ